MGLRDYFDLGFKVGFNSKEKHRLYRACFKGDKELQGRFIDKYGKWWLH